MERNVCKYLCAFAEKNPGLFGFKPTNHYRFKVRKMFIVLNFIFGYRKKISRLLVFSETTELFFSFFHDLFAGSLSQAHLNAFYVRAYSVLHSLEKQATNDREWYGEVKSNANKRKNCNMEKIEIYRIIQIDFGLTSTKDVLQ